MAIVRHGPVSDSNPASIGGLEELRAKMRSLRDAAADKATKYAGRRAANVILEQARANALAFDDSATPESVAKNVTARFSTRTFRSTGNVMFRVGVLGGAKNYANTRENVRKGRAGTSYRTLGDKKNPGGDTWYWRMLEFGTSKADAKPFLRQAAIDKSPDALEEFARAMNAALDRAIKASRR